MYTEKNEAVYTGKERVLASFLLTKEDKKVSPQLDLSVTGHVYREDVTIQENTLLFRGQLWPHLGDAWRAPLGLETKT